MTPAEWVAPQCAASVQRRAVVVTITSYRPAIATAADADVMVTMVAGSSDLFFHQIA